MKLKLTRLLCIALLAAVAAAAQAPAPAASPAAVQQTREYIRKAWDTLTRSPEQCDTYADRRKQRQTAILYLPAGMPKPAVVARLEKECPLEVRHLPHKIEDLASVDLSAIKEHGLLYLEHSYVVPGGFFNEMYGWDSYFILRGLLLDGRVELARGMVDNFLFQIEHYGAILNANRTYFLTRSQPPFLTSMIRDVYAAEQKRGRADRAWLERAYGYAVEDHKFWTTGAHLAGDTGLSRYFDFGEGPAPEVVVHGDPYYRVAATYFLRNPQADQGYLVDAASDEAMPYPEWPAFSLQVCGKDEAGGGGEKCTPVKKVGLTPRFYKGDRSMRESGYDISYRFGPLSAATHDYAAVCLNSLLYKAETDLAEIAQMLGKADESKQWQERARRRSERFNRYLWDADRGLYFDYDVRAGGRSGYEYVTTLFPLWVGLASKEQAAAVMRNLPLLEQPGGLAMSRHETRAQWDYPYGWAPNHLVAVEGMRRYGYDEDADRISRNFTTMVTENLLRDGTIREKYDVVRRTMETRVEAGYTENVVGFGWTNGVWLVLREGLERK